MLSNYGGPMSLGDLKKGVPFILVCLNWWRQVQLDPAELAERHGAEATVPEWHARLACGDCGSPKGGYG